ncbi:MAG: phage baseplate assembly protein V [Desulfobulbaceae bacterium]|nr:phage baseplate assembly protein V [Desulfobulbaceae bacterium]
MVRTFNKLMAPLQRRVMMMVGRCVIALVDDSPKEQGVQIKLLGDEVRTCERYQEYGFTSVPKGQAEGIAVFIGGNREHGIVIATGDRRYRLKGLEAGEVALYDDQGQAIHLKRDKTIHAYGCDHIIADAAVDAKLTAPLVTVVASSKVRLETPLLECTGEIKDRCDTDGKTMEEFRTVYDSHVHGENDNGGPTDQPTQTIG